MRKTGLVVTTLSLLTAVAGFILRRVEVSSIFDPYTGLAERGAPISITLISLTVLTALALLILTLGLPKRQIASFPGAFSGGTRVSLFLTFLGLAVVGLAILEAVFLQSTGDLGARGLFWVSAAIIGGLCLSFTALRGAAGGNVAVAISIPVLWLCAWLIFSYMDRAADPVLLGYVYSFFALAFLILGFYFVAGFAYGKAKSKKLIFCSSMAMYFTGITLADDHSVFQKGIFLCLAVSLMTYQILVSSALYRPEEESVGEAPPTAPDSVPGEGAEPNFDVE